MNKDIDNTFLYFAYGSNLLKRRIHINNPTAEFIGIGRLDDHVLDFMSYSTNWQGTSATIIPKENAHIWGAIWRIDNKDMAALDKQEGVDIKWYFPKTVDIVTSDGDKLKCRTYQQTKNPPLRKEGEERPFVTRPSVTYLDCIIKGAIECNLPPDYIDKLKKINHNGQVAYGMLRKLNLMEEKDGQ